LPPCSDEKIYANLTDFILSAIPLFYALHVGTHDDSQI